LKPVAREGSALIATINRLYRSDHQENLMDSKSTALCLWFTVTLVSMAAASEQPDPAIAAVPVDPAVSRLDDVTQRITDFLKDAPKFHVETTTHWTLQSNPARSGVTRCQIQARKSGEFRLEVKSDAAQKAALICIGDGKQLTRLYQGGPSAVFSRQAGQLANLLDDAMTETSLKGTGLNVILRPDIHAFLMSSVSDVKDVGREEVQGRSAEHFSASWFGGSHIDFWVAADDPPVMLRWKRVMKLNLAGQQQELQMDSQLVWNPDADLADDQIAVHLPQDAIEVHDLQAYLLNGGTDALFGKPAPTAPLKLFDGAEWDLSKHRGQSAVVLFFFATWAVPATQDMPTINTYIDAHSDKGVVFYAISIGEDRDTVRPLLESLKYSHPVVLDPEQKAASAYRVTALPATVLIAKDGTVQAASTGTSPEDLARIRQDIEQLAEGRPLVNPNR
jgi:peroxiredoxin